MMEINMEIDCTICNEINGKPHHFGNKQYNYLIEKEMNIIWSNDFFTIVPSIGALNNGHILIVPNRHILSFHYLENEERDSLKKIKDAIRLFNRHTFNELTEFFEHGTGIKNNDCGSCIAHAHLHSLPVPNSINIHSDILKMRPIEPDEVYNNDNIENGYLYLEDLSGQNWFNNSDFFESQILRKVYSENILKNDAWDWRKSPKIIEVIKVIDNYKDFIVDQD